ncbi:hypothetical protein [Methanobrevibacter sp.]
MARGGYYAGSDYVPYAPGPLSKSSKTSLNERKKQKTIKCSNCGRTVPFKEYCIFCDNKLK